MDARTEWIINKRTEGKTYEYIARNLEKAGFGPNVTKQRIKEIIKKNRPDLMGSGKVIRDKKEKMRQQPPEPPRALA